MFQLLYFLPWISASLHVCYVYDDDDDDDDGGGGVQWTDWNRWSKNRITEQSEH